MAKAQRSFQAIRWGRLRRRENGSVLVFVVVVLVLMIMLATASLQMARTNRFALARIESNNIDTVRTAVISDLARRIGGEDLFNEEGHYLNPDHPLRAGDEPFDHPFTNTDNTDPRNTRTVELIDGSTHTAYGGHRDDNWLASSAPDFSGPDPVWPHLTDVGGLFLHLPTPGGGEPKPLEYVMDHTPGDPAYMRTNASSVATQRITGTVGFDSMDYADATWDFTGADTDGDQIKDARWTWATIRQIGDVRYVMAVRIVDLAAMLNVNVGLSLVDTQFEYIAPDEPRWWYPSELDFASFAFAFDGTEQEVQRTNGYVLNVPVDDPPVALPNPFYGQRIDYWYDGPAQAFPAATGNAPDPFWDPSTIRHHYDPGDHEIELRYRNGLNNPHTEVVLESEHSGLADLMRQSTADTAPPEMGYFDLPCPADATVGCGELGANGMFAYYADNPRLYLTSISGTSHAMPVTQVESSVDMPPMSEDMLEIWKLWEQDDGSPTQDALDMRGDLVELLQEWDMPFGNPADPDDPIAELPIVPYGDRYDAAYQFVACLIDAFDTEAPNLPTGIDAVVDSRITSIQYTHPEQGVKRRYGMEALPFLSEVYVQGAYWLSSAQQTNVAAPPGTEEYDFTWTLEGDIGYAIELTNPFSSPVRDLQHVRLVVNGTWIWGTLHDLIGSPVDPSREARTGIVFYHDAGGDDGLVRDPDDDKISPPGPGSPSGFDTVPAGWIEVDPAISIRFDQDLVGRDLVVELQVLVDPGDGTPGGTEWITYSRIQRSVNDVDVAAGDTILADDSDRLFLPETVTSTGVLVGIPNVSFTLGTADHQRWVQRSARCNNEGLNVIGVVSTATGNEMAGAGTGAAIGSFTPPAADAGTGMETPSPEFPWRDVGLVGESDKGAGLAPAWASDEAMIAGDFEARAYRFDDIALRYATDVLGVMWVGPTETQTFAEVFAAAELGGGIVLDRDMPRRDDRLRMRMFDVDVDVMADENWATDDPASDARMPRAALMLDRITAVPTNRLRTSRIEGRVNLNTATRTILDLALPMPAGDFKDRVLDAVMDMRNGTTAGRWRGTRPGIASLGELLQLGVDDWFTDDVFTATSDEVQIAWDGGGNVADPIHAPVDGRSEETRLTGFLANVASVRSDTFCAYVTIRGYPAGNFSLGIVEATQFMVIYDRSAVKNASDQARVVGVYKLR